MSNKVYVVEMERVDIEAPWISALCQTRDRALQYVEEVLKDFDSKLIGEDMWTYVDGRERTAG